MTSEETQPQFLSDKPIEEVDDDDFRHKEYVDTLEKMVASAEPSWNIGVFGEWGSGKTSIIRMLFSRFSEDDSGYICVEFDAWKHAEESIRTDLLLNLDREIGDKTDQEVDGEPAVLGEEKITRKLYDVEEEQTGEDLSVYEEAKRIYSESKLVGGTTLLILGIILIGAVVNALTILDLLQITDPTLSSMNSILSAFMFPLFISVFVFMAGEVRSATTALRREHPRKEWSGAYEQLFEEIIEGTSAERILISVDNLDRCESETVYDVLVSMKTFLDHDRCIYLIPCDDEALQSHIKSIDREGGYFGDQEDGSRFDIRQNEREFLRKFFQTHIRIPPFIDEDIENYADKNNKELSNKFGQSVVDVITKAYVKNPRRIKQSLNQLTTLYILAEQMEKAGHMVEDRITDNEAFLAKIMVLREDYPEFYNHLQKNPRLLMDVNDYFSGDLTDTKVKSRVKEILEVDTGGGQSDLMQFLRSTKPYKVENPKPFLQLGEPSFASELSDYESFLQLLRTSQVEDVRNELESVDSEDSQLDPYLEAIGERLEDFTVENRWEPLYSTIDCLLQVFDILGEEDKGRVADLLGDYLSLPEVDQYFTDFDPDLLFPVVLRISGENQDVVYQRFASVVVDDGLRQNVLEAFVRNATEIPEHAAETLCSELTRLNDSEFSASLEILSRSEESKKLASSELLKQASREIVWDENRNNIENTDEYLQFDSQAHPRSRSHFVDQLLGLEEQVEQKNDNNAENQYWNQLENLLEELQGQVTRETGETIFNKLKERVSSAGEKPNIAQLAVDFYDSYPPEVREEFKDWIAGLLGTWNQKNVQDLVRYASNQGVDVLDERTAVENVLKRVPDPLGNGNFLTTFLVPEIPDKYTDELVELLAELTEGSDQEQLLAAQIFAALPDRFCEVRSDVLEMSGNQVGRVDSANEKKTFLLAESSVYEQLEDAEKEGFVKRLDSLLSGDQSDHQSFSDIWDRVGEKFGSSRRTTVARNLRGRLSEELRNNIQPQQLYPLLDVFISLSLTGDVDSDDGQWTVERLTDQFEESNLNNNQVGELIEKLAELEDYYGEEEQTMARLESLITSNNDSQIHSNAEKLIKSLEETGQVEQSRIEEVRNQLKS